MELSIAFKAISRLLALFVVLGLTTAASAQGTPGTIKLLSKNKMVTLSTAGGKDDYATIGPTQTAKFLVIGPVTAQVDFRVVLPPDWQPGPQSFLTVLLAGSPHKRFKVTPTLAAEDSFEGIVTAKPSSPTGFYLPLGPGAHVVEFEAQLTKATAASILMVDAKNARIELAQPPPDPPTDNTTTANAVDISGGTDGTNGNTKPKTADDIPVSTNLSFDTKKWGFGAHSGGLFTFDTQAVGGTHGLVLHRVLGGGVGFAFSASFAHFTEERDGDPVAGLSPTLINFTHVPLQLYLTYHLPMSSRVRIYVLAGGGGLLATSDFQQLQVRDDETAFGFAASGGAGFEIDLSREFDGTEEGGQKLFIQLLGGYAGADFSAHDTASVIAGSLTAGVMYRW